MSDIPFDARFQQAFVNFLLRDGTFLGTVAHDITPDLFGDDTLQRIVRLCLSHFEEHKAAPDTLAFQILQNWKDQGTLPESVCQSVSKVLDELFALPLQNRTFLLKEFSNFARQQMAKSQMIPYMEAVEGKNFDKAEEIMKKVFTYRPSQEIDLGRRLETDPTERIKRRLTEDPERLWTLIPEIDRRIPGLRAGELGVFQSQRSSSGKTAALQFLTRSFIFQGKKVFIAILESSEQAYEDRLDMAIAGLTKDLLTDRLKIQKSLTHMFHQGGDLWMKRFPMYTTKISDIRRHVDMLRNVHNFHPDVIINDYADLCAPETKSLAGDLHATGAEVYGHFIGWLQEENMVGWTGLQSNRGSMEATFADQLHAAGSIAKIQAAHLVLSLNRTAEEERDGKTNIFVVKARDEAARYSIVINTDFTRMAFWVRGED